MNDREAFDAQQEAKRETLGPVGKTTRERVAGDLDRYLTAEARHARRTPSVAKSAAGAESTEEPPRRSG